MVMTPGITKAGGGIDNISWNILGQIYVPKQVSESSMSWHATFPPGTFVPPHIHPTQDEFIYMLEGQFELMLDGRTAIANPGCRSRDHRPPCPAVGHRPSPDPNSREPSPVGPWERPR